jgi:hypothetical protein
MKLPRQDSCLGAKDAYPEGIDILEDLVVHIDDRVV